MKRATIATTFLNLGYLALSLQWLWLIVLLLPALLDSSLIAGLSTTQPTSPGPTVNTPGPISYAVAGAAVVLALAVGSYAMFTGPGYAKRHMEKSTKSIAKLSIPTMTGHKKLTTKRKLVLSKRLEYTVKLVLSVVALVGLFVPVIYSLSPLTMDIVFAVGGYLFVWTMVWFTLDFFTRQN